MPFVILGIFLPSALVVVFFVVRANTKIRKRTERLAAQWHQLQAAAAHGRREGAHLLQVVEVYQYARTGSKAIIAWCDTGLRQDAWFEGQRLPPGMFMLVKASSGWGPHNNNPNVLYVSREGVRAWAEQGAPYAAAALQKR